MQASVKSWITKAKIAIFSDTDVSFTENILSVTSAAAENLQPEDARMPTVRMWTAGILLFVWNKCLCVMGYASAFLVFSA